MIRFARSFDMAAAFLLPITMPSPSRPEIILIAEMRTPMLSKVNTVSFNLHSFTIEVCVGVGSGALG